jgi:3-oxoacyl-(acyl-carrier-protein) synthase
MVSPVFIAGAGVISAIGNNIPESISAFENEKTGIGNISHLDTLLKGNFPVAEVKLSNAELAVISGFSPEISRTALLSFVAAREALESSGIKHISSWRTGFISANTVGGMDKSENFYSHYISGTGNSKLRELVYHECGSITELVADRLGISSYVTTISTACSSSANSIAFGARLIRHGILDIVVAGGADSLTKFTLNGFNSLLILDKEYCRPFDEERNGLNLGEGAGYLVLVSEHVSEKLRSGIYCKLLGHSNKNDAFHQTASSPDGKGPYLAMKDALHRSGLLPSDIDYINLHGTGTQNNDMAEGMAIKKLFDPTYPKMSSTKSFTGHTLGASGGVEAVFSVLAVKNGFIYPNLRFKAPMKGLPVVPESTFSKNADLKTVMSNSFGFGGNCTSLIFSKL